MGKLCLIFKSAPKAAGRSPISNRTSYRSSLIIFLASIQSKISVIRISRTLIFPMVLAGIPWDTRLISLHCLNHASKYQHQTQDTEQLYGRVAFFFLYIHCIFHFIIYTFPQSANYFCPFSTRFFHIVLTTSSNFPSTKHPTVTAMTRTV